MRLLAGLLLITLAGGAAGCLPAQSEIPWTSADLGRGTLEVRLLEILIAPFASQTVRFYYRDGDRDRLLAETMLANDGVAPDSGNLEVTGLGAGRWLVILKGDEQADERWILDETDGNARMDRQDGGSDPP